MTEAGLPESAHIYQANDNNQEKRQRLFDVIKERSYFTGEPITLTSGRISDYYFNTKPTMMHSEGSALIASLILDAIKDDNVNLVGGLEMGAVPLAASVASVSHMQGRPVDSFFVRKQAKGHGTNSLIEGLTKDDSMAGKQVVIVEDVTTTGGSAIRAAQTLKEEGATVCQVITVIDRQEGAAAAFSDAGLHFTALFGGSEFRQS